MKTDQNGSLVDVEGVYREDVNVNDNTLNASYKSAITAAKVRAIRKFKYQSSTSGTNRYEYR